MPENEAACETDTGKDVRYVYNYNLPPIFLDFSPNASSLQAIQMGVGFFFCQKMSNFLLFFFFLTLANVIEIES